MTNVIMKTNKGDIAIELFTETMPITAGNFLDLVDKGYYNGLHFHRVIQGFMLQGGCPHSRDPNSPRCGTGDPGYKIADEHTAQISNEPGTLSMANAGPNTNGSQFFITEIPTPWLDGKHTVFGEVTEGMDIVLKICNTPTGPQDRPQTPVVVEKIEVLID